MVQDEGLITYGSKFPFIKNDTRKVRDIPEFNVRVTNGLINLNIDKINDLYDKHYWSILRAKGFGVKSARIVEKFLLQEKERLNSSLLETKVSDQRPDINFIFNEINMLKDRVMNLEKENLKLKNSLGLFLKEIDA